MPSNAFVDPTFGEFEFQPKLGWKRIILLDNLNIEIVLGSDGEPPTDAMMNTARSIVDSWNRLKPRLLDYARNEILTWTTEPDLPNPNDFKLQSLNILWPNTPNTCMIYFDNIGDDERRFHFTLDGLEPQGFAYDH